MAGRGPQCCWGLGLEVVEVEAERGLETEKLRVQDDC